MSEYVHWQAIYETEPFPEERADMRNAELLRMMLITGHAKEIPDIFKLIPDWWGEQPERRQSPEEMMANMSFIKASAKKRRRK